MHFANGDQIKASRLFAALKVGERSWREKPVVVCWVRCYLTVCKVKGRDGKPALQLIISYSQKSCPIKKYGNRWQIETMFKGMNTRGFNLEQTHLKNTERIARLFSLVMMTYTWAYRNPASPHGQEKTAKIPRLKSQELCQIWPGIFGGSAS